MTIERIGRRNNDEMKRRVGDLYLSAGGNVYVILNVHIIKGTH